MATAVTTVLNAALEGKAGEGADGLCNFPSVACQDRWRAHVLCRLYRQFRTSYYLSRLVCHDGRRMCCGNAFGLLA